MRNDGRLVFGVSPSSTTYRTLVSPTALNDGQWHQVVGAMGPDRGLELFVDGKRVARDATTTTARAFSGYWRIGGDGISTSWPNRPTSRSIAGDLDEVAVYPTALPLDRVQQHFVASGPLANIPVPPGGRLRRGDLGRRADALLAAGRRRGAERPQHDDERDGRHGVVGVVFGEPAGRVAPAGHAARLPGGSTQTIVASTSEVNPTVYSLEAWFNTTTTTGGRIIGFGNSQTARAPATTGTSGCSTTAACATASTRTTRRGRSTRRSATTTASGTRSS
jgi:hypothetical protein